MGCLKKTHDILDMLYTLLCSLHLNHIIYIYILYTYDCDESFTSRPAWTLWRRWTTAVSWPSAAARITSLWTVVSPPSSWATTAPVTSPRPGQRSQKAKAAPWRSIKPEAQSQNQGQRRAKDPQTTNSITVYLNSPRQVTQQTTPTLRQLYPQCNAACPITMKVRSALCRAWATALRCRPHSRHSPRGLPCSPTEEPGLRTQGDVWGRSALSLGSSSRPSWVGAPPLSWILQTAPSSGWSSTQFIQKMFRSPTRACRFVPLTFFSHWWGFSFRKNMISLNHKLRLKQRHTLLPKFNILLQIKWLMVWLYVPNDLPRQ